MTFFSCIDAMAKLVIGDHPDGVLDQPGNHSSLVPPGVLPHSMHDDDSGFAIGRRIHLTVQGLTRDMELKWDSIQLVWDWNNKPKIAGLAPYSSKMLKTPQNLGDPILLRSYLWSKSIGNFRLFRNFMSDTK